MISGKGRKEDSPIFLPPFPSYICPLRNPRKGRIGEYYLNRIQKISKGLIFDDIKRILDYDKVRYKLTDREKIVIRCRIEYEMTLKDIGMALGVSGSRIGQIEARAFNKIIHILIRIKGESR